MRHLTLSLAALLVAAPLAAQDSTTTSTTADARVTATLDHAMSAGIPVELLQRKVDEGKAKGVPMDRIAIAVENRLTALTHARDAMLSAGITHTTEGQLSVAADAVQAGVSQAALVAVGRSAPEERRTVAIAVLTQLVASGQLPDQAVAHVQAAIARGPEALANLGASAGANGAANANGAAAAAQGSANAGVRIELGRPRGN
jgi:microcompartment protein CcmK/EutM